MSKEAVGQMNAKIGSSEYWSRVNHNTMLGGLMGANQTIRPPYGSWVDEPAGSSRKFTEICRALAAGSAFWTHPTETPLQNR